MKWQRWRAYRRGLVTNLKEMGAEDTTIQCILRHEDVSTSERLYIKTAPRMAQEAMRQLEAIAYAATCTAGAGEMTPKLFQTMEPTVRLELTTC